MREPWPVVAYRWFGGAILSFFAFAPGWIFVGVLLELYRHPSKADWSALVALAISGALTYFLALLAFRAFTGRGRKEDGGLLPPWAMLGAIHLFGVIAAIIIVVGVVRLEPGPIIGGIGYLAVAYGALAVRRARRNDAE